jgi:hypothetical protein
MGLDWNPLPCPRPGHETEFTRLFEESLRVSGAERDALIKQFQAISQPAFELLGAPRVGIDTAADEWLRNRLAAKGQAEKFEDTRRSMHGYYALALLPPCDGFPWYTNYGTYEGLDRYSFRAQFLTLAEDVIGSTLLERAYAPMLAASLLRYGTELSTAALRYARQHGVEYVQEGKPPEFDEQSPAMRAHIVFSAGRWCLYWANRGHGLEAWW